MYADALYESCKRVAWASAVAWIIFACMNDSGGIVNKFLCLPVWLPISRLSYCIYLLHFLIQDLFVSTLREPVINGDIRTFHIFCGDFSIAFIVAVVWSLAFEYPVRNILEIFFKRRENVVISKN